jgi:hypothetical protein
MATLPLLVHLWGQRTHTLGPWLSRHWVYLQKKQSCRALLTDTCNSSYSGGRNQEDHGSKPDWANSSVRPYLETPFTKLELVLWLKVKALVQGSVPQKKKKKKNPVSWGKHAGADSVGPAEPQRLALYSVSWWFLLDGVPRGAGPQCSIDGTWRDGSHIGFCPEAWPSHPSRQKETLVLRQCCPGPRNTESPCLLLKIWGQYLPR